MRAELRLTPAAASRKLQVLEFIRRYLTDWGCSPSLGEIANALDISRTRARQHVKRLVAEGRLVRGAGRERNLRLPPEEMSAVEAVRVLRASGWKVDEDAEAADPCAISTLAGLPLLDHPSGHERDGGERGRAGRDAGDRSALRQTGARRARGRQG